MRTTRLLSLAVLASFAACKAPKPKDRWTFAESCRGEKLAPGERIVRFDATLSSATDCQGVTTTFVSAADADGDGKLSETEVLKMGQSDTRCPWLRDAVFGHADNPLDRGLKLVPGSAEREWFVSPLADVVWQPPNARKFHTVAVTDRCRYLAMP